MPPRAWPKPATTRSRRPSRSRSAARVRTGRGSRRTRRVTRQPSSSSVRGESRRTTAPRGRFPGGEGADQGDETGAALEGGEVDRRRIDGNLRHRPEGAVVDPDPAPRGVADEDEPRLLVDEEGGDRGGLAVGAGRGKANREPGGGPLRRRSGGQALGERAVTVVIEDLRPVGKRQERRRRVGAGRKARVRPPAPPPELVDPEPRPHLGEHVAGPRLAVEGGGLGRRVTTPAPPRRERRPLPPPPVPHPRRRRRPDSRPTASPMGSSMADERGAIELYEVVLVKGRDDTPQVPPKQAFQLSISDIAGSDQAKLVRLVPQQKRIDEVFILGDDSSSFANGNSVEFGIPGTVPVRKIEGMNGIVSFAPKPIRQSSGKLCVDQEPHPVTAWNLFTWLRRAAKAKAARISFRSRST